MKDNRDWRFPRVWAAFLLLLIAITHRLWLPLTEFPSVPMVPGFSSKPGWVGWIPGILVVISAIAAIAMPARRPWAWLAVSGSLLLAFLFDQHRLQPWAYQSALYALVFASMPASAARRWLTPLAASVYLYSAAGKLDFQFTHTVGQDFLSAAAAPLGGLPEAIGPTARVRLAFLFPAIELAIGLGLLVPKTRRIAGVAAAIMHVALVGALGPWNLDHSLGVLTWNALLIVQACFLFVRREAAAGDGETAGWLAVAARAAVCLAVVLPIAERTGYWDHWLSWSLYSPHNSRVDVEIHGAAAEDLSETARRYLEPDADGDGWRSFAIDRWSLERLGAPIYPQARYQLAVAVAVARRAGIDSEIRAIVKGVSDRWTGRRAETRLLGRDELEARLEEYWLVSVPE